MKNYKIYVVGTGAIGKALAVFLKEEGMDVILIRGSVDNTPTKKEVIKVVNQDGKKIIQELEVTTFGNLKEINGIVLLATKTFGNEEISNKIKYIKGEFAIVLLQNGLNVEKPFTDFQEVYRCVLFSTSQIVDNNEISFKTVMPSPIGVIIGENVKMQEVVQKINTQYFGFRSEININKFIWDKAVINCAYNSICPLLEIDNGIFHRNSEVTVIAKSIIEECVDLAKEYDIELNKEEIENKLLLISKKSDGQLISTYEDLNNKRRTEIENLNLEIARMADEIGKPYLVKNTRLLGEMIKIKSEMGIVKRKEENEPTTNKGYDAHAS